VGKVTDTPDESRTISILVLEDVERFGLKIPEFAVELHGEDLVTLIELAEEQLWWRLEASGDPMPGATTLAIKRVTKEEFGPTCYERRAEEETWPDDE
jgi:hypothetical protein